MLSQFVSDQWSMTADLRAQYLRAQGFLVLKVDNRGSYRRGLAFEMPIRKRMGTVEVDDQVYQFSDSSTVRILLQCILKSCHEIEHLNLLMNSLKSVLPRNLPSF